jgi:hypothetical protein
MDHACWFSNCTTFRRRSTRDIQISWKRTGKDRNRRVFSVAHPHDGSGRRRDRSTRSVVLHGPNGDQSPELSAKIKEWSSANKWFKLNVDQTGFFRVAYTQEQWERLAAVMDPADSPLSTTDRLGLLSDSFAAGRAGYSPIVDSLTLVSKFGEHETAGEWFFGLCEFLTLCNLTLFLSLSRICSLARAFREPVCSCHSFPFRGVLFQTAVCLQSNLFASTESSWLEQQAG